jgi:hypothetical protein
MQGLFEMMDAAVCEFLHITMDQLEYITEKSTIEELQEMTDVVFDEETTISDVKRAIQIRDKYLKQNGIWVELEPQTGAE